MKQSIHLPLVLCFWLCPTASPAQGPDGGWLQLHKLNQESRQALEEIQRDVAVQEAAKSQQTIRQQSNLNRQQRIEQQFLQEQQRQRLMILDQRRRTSPQVEPPDRPGAIFRQQLFRQQQLNQLYRFRAQQQMRR